MEYLQKQQISWISEKQQIQKTVIALSHEVDFLSTSNMQFLQDLKQKDGFYETYRQTVEELTKLREAHAVLIDMIKNHHIQVTDNDTILETELDSAEGRPMD